MFLFILSHCSLPKHPLFQAFTEGKKSKGVAQWKQLIQKTGFELWSFALLNHAHSAWSAYRLSCRWALDTRFYGVSAWIISSLSGRQFPMREDVNIMFSWMQVLATWRGAFLYTELLLMTEGAVTALRFTAARLSEADGKSGCLEISWRFWFIGSGFVFWSP